MNGFYWIYLVMIAFLLGYESSRDKENKRLIYYGACGFLLLIFIAQDFSVGVDTAEYMRQWEIIPNLSLSQMFVHKFEIGYVILCWLLERVFVSDRVLLVAVGMLVMLPFCRFFEEETENPMITLTAFLALGIYMHAITFWRQLIAMAILTRSFRYIRERRMIPFLLTVLAAMTFHRSAMVFFPLYFVYHVPINKWLLLCCAAMAIVLNFLAEPILDFAIARIYPSYLTYLRQVDGGYTLLALLWVVILLSYWLLRDRMHEPDVRISFQMLLAAAMIQPICFSWDTFSRIVLFFRVAMVPMTTYLYSALFMHPDNKAMALLKRYVPRLHAVVYPMYSKRAFRVITQLLLFAVLFVWYVSELDDVVYVMAPIVME